MAIIPNLALFFILGVLQVSCSEYKYIKLGSTVCEDKCLEKTTALCKDGSKHMQLLKENLVAKDRTIQRFQEFIASVNQCCGKETEEKKCLKEVVFPQLQKLLYTLSVNELIYVGIFAENFVNISMLATYAENEIDCCCTKLDDSCVPKFEVPTSIYKGSIKECKSEICTRALNLFMKEIAEFVVREMDTKVVLARVIENCERLQKLKEGIPKDGKCKEGKELLAVKKEIHNLSLTINWLVLIQNVQNSQGGVILQDAAAAAREIVQCPEEKYSKQFSPCSML